MNTFIYFTNEKERQWALDYFRKKGKNINNVANGLNVNSCVYLIRDDVWCSGCSLEAATIYLKNHAGELIHASKQMKTKLDFYLSLINN